MSLTKDDLKAIQLLLVPIVDRIQQVEVHMGKRFTAVDERVNCMGERFTALEERMDVRFAEVEDRMTDRFAEVEERMIERFIAAEDRVNERFNAIEDRISERFNTVDMNFDALFKRDETRQQEYLVLTNQTSRIEVRVAALEKIQGLPPDIGE